MSEKRYCPYCGHEIDPSWKACPYCGHSLMGTATTVNKNSVLYGIALAFGILFVVLAIYMGYQSSVVVSGIAPFLQSQQSSGSSILLTNYTINLLSFFQDSAVTGAIFSVIGVSLLGVAVVKRKYILLSAAFNAVSVGMFILAQTALAMLTVLGVSMVYQNQKAEAYAPSVVNASTYFQYANLTYGIVGAFLLFFTLFLHLKQNESKKQK